MEETEKNIPKETESAEEVKTKSMWQVQKESWYDKVPLNLKQLDIIIAICLILLALTFVVIFLDAADIINPFGY
mgnify:CR=1 FL=1